jgi:hypothetical protein
MAGAHILAAQSGQATFAGNTRPAGEVPAGLPAAPTLHEAGWMAGLTSELDGIVSGGFHPETIAAAVAAPANRALERVGGQMAGPHGGAVPRPYSGATPGPAGESVAARGRALLSRLGF